MYVGESTSSNIHKETGRGGLQWMKDKTAPLSNRSRRGKAEDFYQVWRARFIVCQTGGLELTNGRSQVELITEHLQKAD